MYLITMAHLGEAQGVIDQFNLSKTRPNLFQGQELTLLLTGEGPFEAASLTAYELALHKFSEVVNLGIAGSLSPELSLNQIYAIRTHYLVNDLKPSFKSFTGNSEGIDCLTSFERILDIDKAKVLRGVGQVVDREAWGVAFSSKTQGVPFRSYKLISDVAGTLDACEAVKEKAPYYAEQLATFLRTIIKTTERVEDDLKIDLPGFHFTFTTAHRFHNLLKKISNKKNQSTDETIKNISLDLHRALPHSKERVKSLLESMEVELDPLKEILKSKKEIWLKDLKSSGIQVVTDPQWESSKVTIQFETDNDQDLKKKLQNLETFSLKPFHDLQQGKLHVE